MNKKIFSSQPFLYFLDVVRKMVIYQTFALISSNFMWEKVAHPILGKD